MKNDHSTLTMEMLLREYVENQRSAASIAKEFDCDAKKITRLLRHYGIKVRSREEGRKLHETQHGHPKQGTTVSTEVKQKISETQAKNWTAERRENQKTKISEHWKNGEYSNEVLAKAHEGLRKAAKEGSKIEKLIVGYLEEMGMKCVTQEQLLFENLNLKCDIWVPAKDLVIEADGCSHYYPIWGQERLEKQMASDAEKNALLLSKGLKVLRFGVMIKHMSQKHERRLKEELVRALDILFKHGGIQYVRYGEEEEDQ